MSVHLDYAELSRQARRIIDAGRASAVLDQAAANGNRQPERVKFTRSTNGCLACRKQKVKCDETTPTCLRCIAAQRHCEFPPPKSNSGSQRSSGSKRKASSAGNESSTADSTPTAPPASAAPASGGGPLSVISGGPQNGLMMAGNGPDVFNMAGPSTQAGRMPRSPLNMDSEWTSGIPDMGVMDDFMSFVATLPPVVSPTTTVSPTDPATTPRPSQRSKPPYENLDRSLLANRRKRKRMQRASQPEVYLAPPNPRLLMVESILEAYSNDVDLFEFGPSNRQQIWPDLAQVNTDVLSNAFPSHTARSLFHHYCNTASRILVTMGNIGPNPLLTLCTPLRLLDTTSPAAAAIRMSVLSISVHHFAYEVKELLREEVVGWEERWLKLKELGGKFKKAALADVLLAATGDCGTETVDSVLAACTLLCIRDVISADPSWRDNLDFALNFINKKGGPQAMLAGSDYSFTRRFLLENLATHDMFSSFITGKEPMLLGNYDTWWFDSVETSQTRWEWESVERTFGVSRAMVDLMARIAVLDSKKRRLGIRIKGENDEMPDIVQHFVRESQCLLVELDIWGKSLSQLPQHVRVTCGDYIYKYMAVIFIMADILEEPTVHQQIVTCVDHVLELISEAAAMRMSVMLMWPLLIAGTFCLPPVREKVTSLCDALKGDYCEDLEVGRAVIEEQWRCIDSGEGKLPWDVAMKRLGRYALLI